MEEIVYIPVKNSEITNEQLVEFREVKKTLENVYDKLVKVYGKYKHFRELDIMLQKVEEAILWSHRVIALEAEEEKLKQETLEKTEVKCDKEDCCKKDPCEKSNDVTDNNNKTSQDFLNKFKNISVDNTEKHDKEKMKILTF